VLRKKKERELRHQGEGEKRERNGLDKGGKKERKVSIQNSQIPGKQEGGERELNLTRAYAHYRRKKEKWGGGVDNGGCDPQ